MPTFTSGKEWAKYGKDWLLTTMDDVEDIVKQVAVVIFAEVIDRTPVWFTFHKHSGTAKFNWIASLDSPVAQVREGTDISGKQTKSEMRAVVRKFGKRNAWVWLSNSVPYIHILEDGGFPQAVARGSYNTETHAYEIRSADRYSKQAPNGMVKIASQIFSTIVDEIAKKKGFR